jgi:hypothetical protein
MALSNDLLVRLLGAVETDSLVFLCGAGLSIPAPSNLLSAVAVCRKWYDEWQPIETLNPILRDDIDGLAEHFYNRGDFEKVFIPRIPWNDFVGVPNEGHSAVADFLICRAARGALSANFDALIERWAESHKVCLRGALDGQEADVFDSVSRPLVKFHGCLLRDRERTLWTRAQLAEPLVSARVDGCSNWMQIVLPGRHLVVVGFWTDWGYLNDVLAKALSLAKAQSVIVVDIAETTDLKIKAPDLWQTLTDLSIQFEHVKASGAEVLTELRTAFSRTWARRFFGLGVGLCTAPAAATIASTVADSMAGPALYDLRRDGEGVPYTTAARSRSPSPASAQTASFQLTLLAAGASQAGAWFKFSGKQIRVINGAGQALSRVRDQYKEPASASQPDIVVCAGSIDIGVPATLIPHASPMSIVRARGGGVAKWMTIEQAKAELAI